MTNTTTLIQSLKLIEAWHDGKTDWTELRGMPLVSETCRNAIDALEQQAAQIDALRADAERMRVALNVIAERQSSEWPERCRINVQTARSVLDLIDGIDAALRQEQPKGEGA